MPIDEKALMKSKLTSLAASAGSLKVVMEVDAEKLETELRPYFEGLDTLVLNAKNLRVTDDESNERCCEMMNDASRRAKGLLAIIDRFRDPLNGARAHVLDLEKKTVTVADDARKAFAKKSSDYLTQKWRDQQKVEARLATAATKTRNELNSQADALVLEGRFQEAAALREESQCVVAPTLPDMVKTPSSARATPKWVATPVDTIATLKAIVEGKVSLMQTVKDGDDRPLVVIDQVVLNALVSRLGDGLKIPGILVEDKVAVSAKGTR